MILAQTALTLLFDHSAPWDSDWMWGIPLILVTVIFHVTGLGVIRQRTARIYREFTKRSHAPVAFTVVMGTTTLIATCLHGIEALIWAAAYCLIGAVPDFKSGMLYSMGAMTTYGHENLHLAEHWQLLGPIEALSGWLLFGLSTAFLFSMIEIISPADRTRV